MFVSAVVAFALGVSLWTFAEYALHNWGGHVPKGKTRLSKDHLTHHARYLWFTPTIDKVMAAVKALAVLIPISMWIAGPVAGGVFCGGFIACYALYEWLHRRAHVAAPIGPYGRWLRKHHFHHHFASPKNNHGVTSPLWDVIFRSYSHPGQVRVPRRHAMLWLCDDAGEVLPRYRDDYVLVGRKQRPDSSSDSSSDSTAADETRAFDNAAPAA